ncbi:MAG: perosamine synthetase [Acidobacteriota bacterium]|nr:perosamine synthetase [Acidobacteriota bacterium]
MAALANRRYCVAVNSGSSALIALLIALGISDTSEVIVPVMSFFAVPAAVTRVGAVPVLADIDNAAGMITVETVSPCFSEKTKAVIAIDYSGFTNDWQDLDRLCKDSGVPLIIDAASSFLAAANGKPAGSYGHAAIFSFHAAKPITTGEGGAIVTDDEELTMLLKKIRNHGEVDDCKYYYDYLGSNFRMTDIAASIGISQINKKDTILDHRRRIIDYYLENPLLREIAHPAYKSAGFISNGLTFTILHPARDKIREALLEAGIDTRIMWPYCVDQQPVYRQYPVKITGELNNARQFSQSSLSLPVHTGIDRQQVDQICEIVQKTISTTPGR